MAPDKKISLITWLDANCDSSWQPSDHVMEPVTCYTVGWVQNEAETFIQIAATLADDGNYNQSMTIPRGMVVSIKEI